MTDEEMLDLYNNFRDNLPDHARKHHDFMGNYVSFYARESLRKDAFDEEAAIMEKEKIILENHRLCKDQCGI